MLLRLLWILITGFASICVNAQCKIKNRVNADGTMFYYMDPVQFYKTSERQLRGNVTTDRDNYFLSFLPAPFPAKPGGFKLKKNVSVKLSNDKVYILEHYDSRYLEDSVLILMFELKKAYIADFRKYEVEQVVLNMGDKEGPRVYDLKLYRSAVIEGLNCFMKKEE
ncbi:hypothetical protein ACI6Q2_10845 [Chitinophagaceae bacterium LWZ2-11]